MLSDELEAEERRGAEAHECEALARFKVKANTASRQDKEVRGKKIKERGANGMFFMLKNTVEAKLRHTGARIDEKLTVGRSRGNKEEGRKDRKKKAERKKTMYLRKHSLLPHPLSEIGNRARDFARRRRNGRRRAEGHENTVSETACVLFYR